MTELWVADSGIRQLHARFDDAVWRKDADAFADLFTEDGEWKIAGFHFKGRTDLREGFAKLLGLCKRVRIIQGMPLLEVGERAATGRISITELTQMADGSSAMALGTYYDWYVEDGDRWLFQKRHWGFHYRGPFDVSAPFADYPDFGAPPNMPGADEPTFVRKK